MKPNIKEIRAKYYGTAPRPKITLGQLRKNYLLELNGLFEADLDILAEDQAILNRYKKNHPTHTAIITASQQRINNRVQSLCDIKICINKVLQLEEIMKLQNWAMGNTIGRQTERIRKNGN